jgi:hypothetical protein
LRYMPRSGRRRCSAGLWIYRTSQPTPCLNDGAHTQCAVVRLLCHSTCCSINVLAGTSWVI